MTLPAITLYFVIETLEHIIKIYMLLFYFYKNKYKKIHLFLIFDNIIHFLNLILTHSKITR
jgi:hypothetical protein